MHQYVTCFNSLSLSHSISIYTHMYIQYKIYLYIYIFVYLYIYLYHIYAYCCNIIWTVYVNYHCHPGAPPIQSDTITTKNLTMFQAWSSQPGLLGCSACEIYIWKVNRDIVWILHVWNIYLHLGDFWVNVGKHSIHGSFG